MMLLSEPLKQLVTRYVDLCDTYIADQSCCGERLIMAYGVGNSLDDMFVYVYQKKLRKLAKRIIKSHGSVTEKMLVLICEYEDVKFIEWLFKHRLYDARYNNLVLRYASLEICHAVFKHQGGSYDDWLARACAADNELMCAFFCARGATYCTYCKNREHPALDYDEW